MRGITLKTYRLGNIVVELRRKDKGARGVFDYYVINRLYTENKTRRIEKTKLYTKADMRDLMCLLMILNANVVEIEETNQ